jgi:hypothetical protein
MFDLLPMKRLIVIIASLHEAIEMSFQNWSRRIALRADRQGRKKQ